MVVPLVPVRIEVSVKGKKAKRRPTQFAIGLDGNLYFSVFELDGVEDLQTALDALPADATCFVGIVATRAERHQLVVRLRSAGSEAAAFIAGHRRWAR